MLIFTYLTTTRISSPDFLKFIMLHTIHNSLHTWKKITIPLKRYVVDFSAAQKFLAKYVINVTFGATIYSFLYFTGY